MTGKPEWLPERSVADLDAVLAFTLFLLPGSLVYRLLSDTGSSGEPEIYAGVVSLLTGFVCTLAYWLVRRPAVPLSLRSGWALSRYGLFLLWWFPLAFVVYPTVVRALGYHVPAQEMLVYLTSRPDEVFWWVGLAVVCIGAPLGEEIFFRGFLFRPIELRFGPWPAILVTSVVFGLVHEPSVAVPITVLGGFFGYVRMKTGGIGSSILLHMVHNTWTVWLAIGAPHLMDFVFDK